MKKKERYKSLMNKSAAYKLVDQEHEEYYTGYQRGLRRAFYDDFGTDEQHHLWYSIPENETDTGRRLRGQGYRDGYYEKKPKQWEFDIYKYH